MGHDDVAALAELRGIRADGAAHHMARLIEENAALRREVVVLRRLRDHVETNAGYLTSCVERSRTYS